MKTKRELEKESMFLRNRLNAVSNLVNTLMDCEYRDDIMIYRTLGRILALADSESIEYCLDFIKECDREDFFDSEYFDKEKVLEMLKK